MTQAPPEPSRKASIDAAHLAIIARLRRIIVQLRTSWATTAHYKYLDALYDCCAMPALDESRLPWGRRDGRSDTPRQADIFCTTARRAVRQLWTWGGQDRVAVPPDLEMTLQRLEDYLTGETVYVLEGDPGRGYDLVTAESEKARVAATEKAEIDRATKHSEK